MSSRCVSSPRGSRTHPTEFQYAGSAGSSAAWEQVEYTYDPSGRRIAKDVDGVVTKYLGVCLMNTDAKCLGVDGIALLRRHERTGWPLGETAFLDRIERRLGRRVRPAKAGRKPKRREI